MLLLLGGIVARTKQRHLAALVGFGAVALGFGCALLTCLEVGGSPAESHRFMTLPEVVLPLLLLSVANLASRPERVIMALVLVVSVVFTVAWKVSAGSKVLKLISCRTASRRAYITSTAAKRRARDCSSTRARPTRPKTSGACGRDVAPVLAPSEKPPPSTW